MFTKNNFFSSELLRWTYLVNGAGTMVSARMILNQSRQITLTLGLTVELASDSESLSKGLLHSRG